MITYTFTVYNIGDAYLNNVTVLDPMFPDSLNHYIGDMSAGSEVTFTVEYQTDANTPSKAREHCDGLWQVRLHAVV